MGLPGSKRGLIYDIRPMGSAKPNSRRANSIGQDAPPLITRSHIIWLPAFVVVYAGDTLWALFVFLGIAVIAPSAPTIRVAVLAALVSLADEISQLCHPPWLDALRHTWLGGLVLGYGFQWSDLVCYGVGIAMGACTKCLVRRSEEHRTKDL
jgi:hypothetical protein